MHYIPKTDYVAFCLPVLALALGRVKCILLGKEFEWKQLLGIASSLFALIATLRFSCILCAGCQERHDACSHSLFSIRGDFGFC
jgi:hypothetical protein